MDLTIFGATGGIGAHVVEQALARGHRVTAFARRPEAVLAKSDRLRVVEGDAISGTGVREALRRESIVISCLGSRTPTRRGDPVASRGAMHIVEGMRAVGASRLIAISSIGLGAWRENPWLVNLLVRPAFALFFAAARDDFEAMEAHVAASSLEWTLVRASSLTDGRSRRRFLADPDTSHSGPFISRADVASFLVDEAEKPAHVRSRIALSNGWSELLRFG